MSETKTTPAIIIFVLVCVILLFLPVLTIGKTFLPTMPNWLVMSGAILQLIVLGFILMKSKDLVTFLQLSMAFSSVSRAKEEFIKSKAKPKVKPT